MVVQIHSGQTNNRSLSTRHHQNPRVAEVCLSVCGCWEHPSPLPVSWESQLHTYVLSDDARQQISHEEEEFNDSKLQGSEQSKLPICCLVWWSENISVPWEWGAGFLTQLKTAQRCTLQWTFAKLWVLCYFSYSKEEIQLKWETDVYFPTDYNIAAVWTSVTGKLQGTMALINTVSLVDILFIYLSIYL